ncbi:MAG: divalent metal cation transporter, partial [Phycisphaerales bacterium]|nr:divalent metal cation transporter [Phycisphaerales bacterium]
GSATQALVPLPLEGSGGRVVWGGLCSIVAVVLAWRGGYRLFEKIMAVCIGVMTLAVITTAVLVDVDWSATAVGLVTPSIPDVEGALGWTTALLGGVGGTVTLLCYGYWIRQRGRTAIDMLKTCRIDLAAGYLVTALFGVAMVCIASVLEPVDGQAGAALITALAGQLEAGLGTWAGLVFLIGAWAALFSSVLGVWQSVPIIMADCVRAGQGKQALGADALERTPLARGVMIALATVPLLHVAQPFDQVQQVYAVIGALFLPLLALVLLAITTRRGWMGVHRTGTLGMTGLVAVLALFGWLAVSKWT